MVAAEPTIAFIVLGIYIVIIICLLYVLLFGSNECHENGIVPSTAVPHIRQPFTF